jgi:hypothetical protein
MYNEFIIVPIGGSVLYRFISHAVAFVIIKIIHYRNRLMQRFYNSFTLKLHEVERTLFCKRFKFHANSVKNCSCNSNSTIRGPYTYFYNNTSPVPFYFIWIRKLLTSVRDWIRTWASDFGLIPPEDVFWETVIGIIIRANFSLFFSNFGIVGIASSARHWVGRWRQQMVN